MSKCRRLTALIHVLFKQLDMALSSSLNIEEYGTVQSPASNVPFSVEAPDSVWIVQSGKLDLFLVDVKNGEPVGARYHVLRVEVGQAVFGIGTHFENVRLIATAAAATQLLHVKQKSLREMASSERQDFA
jgi:hypothetical protein